MERKLCHMMSQVLRCEVGIFDDDVVAIVNKACNYAPTIRRNQAVGIERPDRQEDALAWRVDKPFG
ncbi:MAG: hypothetical protein HY684_06475 [Chloroflexi bacterium]|nr:hypothetical protein [Chloroflexota bacterium]